jgi:hypothetical protein
MVQALGQTGFGITPLKITYLSMICHALGELVCKAVHIPKNFMTSFDDGHLVPGDGTNVGFTELGRGGMFEVSSFRGRAVRASCDPQGSQDAS